MRFCSTDQAWFDSKHKFRMRIDTLPSCSPLPSSGVDTSSPGVLVFVSSCPVPVLQPSHGPPVYPGGSLLILPLRLHCLHFSSSFFRVVFTPTSSPFCNGHSVMTVTFQDHPTRLHVGTASSGADCYLPAGMSGPHQAPESPPFLQPTGAPPLPPASTGQPPSRAALPSRPRPCCSYPQTLTPCSFTLSSIWSSFPFHRLLWASVTRLLCGRSAPSYPRMLTVSGSPSHQKHCLFCEMTSFP